MLSASCRLKCKICRHAAAVAGAAADFGLWAAGRRAADRAYNLLALPRKAPRILLEAGQRRRAAGWHGGALRLVVGTAGLADRIDLRLGGLLGEYRTSHTKQDDSRN
jgi:hypothetical protein